VLKLKTDLTDKLQKHTQDALAEKSKFEARIKELETAFDKLK